MTSTLTVPYQVICEDTTKLARPEWLTLRRQGIGSSDAAAVMESSPYHSAYSVHAEKAGLWDPEDEKKRDFFDWRLALEPVILDHADHQEDIGPMQRNLMLRSIEYPHMLANPDGLTPTQVVESKTANGWDESRWDFGIPDHYCYQGMHLMIVSGKRQCVFPVMFGCNEPRYFVLDWDQRLADLLIEQEAEFWANVLAGKAPDPDGSESTMEAVRAIYYESVDDKGCDLGPETRSLLDARNVAQAVKNDADTTINAIKQTLMIEMDDAEVAYFEEKKVATWKPNKNGVRVFRFSDKGDS